jgi:outer membrane lipoprotein-sorting protein
MSWRHSMAAWAVAACLTGAALAQQPPPPGAPTASQILEKNAVARGGTEAWRKIDSMAWTGHVESRDARGHQLSFLLEQKRPQRARFEIVAEGQKSIRVYDGANGWKMRMTPGGKPELQPYSEVELEYARGAPVIEGPLMDYAAKGVPFALVGLDTVEGRQAYVLDAKPASGARQRIWVDAESFLEVRHDREYRNRSGQTSIATVYFRDYRAFEGLLLPVTIETGVVDGQAANKLVIERVALNPPVDNGIFTKPQAAGRHLGAVVVDTRGVESKPSASAMQR